MGTEVFIRRASGLVRVVSPWDALIYAFCNPGPVYSWTYIVWASYLYPGAHMPLAVLMVLLLLPTMAVYWLFSVSMPRSGGEYLYVSRILHPSLGLFSCWALTIVGISWTGCLTSWEVNWGVAPFFLNEGLLRGSEKLINTGLALYQPIGSNLVYIVGCILLIITFLNMWIGTKSVMIASWISVIISFIGLGCIMYASWTCPKSVFIARLENLTKIPAVSQRVAEITGGEINYVDWEWMMAKGQELGWGGPGKFSTLSTIMAGCTYVNLNTLGSTYTANIAGEIKEVTKAQPLALFGSLFMFMLFWGLFYSTVWFSVPTSDFYGAIAYLDAYGINPIPWFPVGNQLVVFMTGNRFLVHGATLGFFMGNYGGMLGLSFGPSRNIFAWSFDRILPPWIAKVDRRGSPWVAVFVSGLLAWIFFTINNYTPWLQFIMFTITLWFAGWTVTGIAGMLFPYLRRDIFERSPEVVKKRIGGVPLITIMGALMAGISAWTVYATTVPAIVGLMELIFLGTTVIILGVVPFIIYVIAHFYWKAKGIPFELQFKEIPPD